MRYLFYPALLFLLGGTILISCKKNQIEPTPLSSLTVVNTIIGGMAAKMGSNSAAISNNSSMQFGLKAGNNNIFIFPLNDSATPYYNKLLKSSNGEVFTLFLAGAVASVEDILVNEQIPYRTDSTFGLRFINLSPNSSAIKITLSTSTTISEFGDLPYKQLSDFKSYPALSTNTTYTFQVRNAVTDAIITSTTITGLAITTGIPRLQNITLVFRGNVGGTPAPGFTRVNHF